MPEEFKRRPLDADERMLREAYRRGPTELWEKPMSFFAYEQLLQMGKTIETPNSHLFKDTSKNAMGVTIDEIPLQDQVYAVVHPRYSYPLQHNHEYLEIVYVASGTCVNLLEAGALPMHTGDVCIMAPTAQHALSCTDDESCVINLMVNRRFFGERFLRILRGGKVLADYLEEILIDREVNSYILFHTQEDPWLQELASRILSELREKEYGYEYSISLLAGQFLLQLVRKYEESAVMAGGSSQRQSDLIVGVLNYLIVHFSHTSLNDTAKYFGYSPAYLSRVLHEKTGKPFHRIITEMQAERAARLMDAGVRNFTEIAQEVGCYDTSHLHKKFKTVYGMSPRQYLTRKLQEKNEEIPEK